VWRHPLYLILFSFAITTYGMVNVAIQAVLNWPTGFLRFEVLFVALTALLPLIGDLFVRWLDALREPVTAAVAETNWLDEQTGSVFALERLVLAGLAMTGIGMFCTSLYFAPWCGWVCGLFYVLCVLFFFGYGAFAYAFIALIVLVSRLGNVTVAAGVFRWPLEALHTIYRIFFRFTLLASVLYIVAVTSVWISGMGGRSIATETDVGRLWVLPPAIAIITYLLTFHFQVHALIRRCKRQAENQLIEVMEAAYTTWSKDQDPRNESIISSAVAWREHIRGIDEWPTRARWVVVIITTLLIPTLQLLADVLH
jgi:hypothetical protein